MFEYIGNFFTKRALDALSQEGKDVQLMYSIINNNPKQEKLLREVGAKASQKAKDTCLLLSLYKNDFKAVESFCEAGADIDAKPNGISMLAIAADKQNIEVVKYCLEHQTRNEAWNDDINKLLEIEFGCISEIIKSSMLDYQVEGSKDYLASKSSFMKRGIEIAELLIAALAPKNTVNNISDNVNIIQDDINAYKELMLPKVIAVYDKILSTCAYINLSKIMGAMTPDTNEETIVVDWIKIPGSMTPDTNEETILVGVHTDENLIA